MRISVIVFFAIFLLGCVSTYNGDFGGGISQGMSESDVMKLLGKPIATVHKNESEICHMYPAKEGVTDIVFVDGFLFSAGSDLCYPFH